MIYEFHQRVHKSPVWKHQLHWYATRATLELDNYVLRAAVEEDPRQAIEELTTVFHSTVRSHLLNVCCVSKLGKWISRELTSEEHGNIFQCPIDRLHWRAILGPIGDWRRKMNLFTTTLNANVSRCLKKMQSEKWQNKNSTHTKWWCGFGGICAIFWIGATEPVSHGRG